MERKEKEPLEDGILFILNLLLYFAGICKVRSRRQRNRQGKYGNEDRNREAEETPHKTNRQINKKQKQKQANRQNPMKIQRGTE